MNRDDAEIAKRLTDKWIDIVRSRVMKTISPSSTQFLAQLKAKARFTLYYRRPDLLEKALNIIPLQRLYDEAEQKVEEGSLEDKVVQRLLHWFKSEFFHWVNNATCIHCTSVSVITLFKKENQSILT
ncbi:hypothetical protein BD560DRAFT_63618 [Blakeslea trispora]|nr:hypothetical protein BD560DRAFT_63618 [Blakeslea trispora]